ncbi:MAG TPA: polyhydroxyalkanoate depolymerase [Stellaceae bacterium]|nr:polyhydroxyalkanoate depolymerase [Stellaceae bacterium]
MLYTAYQVHSDVLAPVRLMAEATRGWLQHPWPMVGGHPVVRGLAAACELMARAGMSHQRPAFGLAETTVAGRIVAVHEEVASEQPFCNLVHFRKETVVEQPRVLVVAPLSGHFSTLLRGTVEALLPDHDVYLADWINARNVPLVHGRFDLDDYIDLIIAQLRHLGPKTHVIAVCQPSVPVLAAVSLMAAENDPAAPASMTLMGGPIDTRVNPTAVSTFGEQHSLDWFERHVIATVPGRYPGAFRRVYPGFLQLAGFVSMNLERHVSAHVDLFRHLVRGDGESAQATKSFYDEYLSVMDLPADFYLQTVERVFQEHALATDRFFSRDRKVEPRAISRTALLCVEGEKDDICAVGQTHAALELCSGIPDGRRAYHMQPKVGHYGVFNGRRWREEILPKVRDFIRANG